MNVTTTPCALGAYLVLASAICRRVSSRRRAAASMRRASFGPKPYDMKQRDDMIQDEVGKRLLYVIKENKSGIQTQLQQYGFAQIDGLLGGSIYGLPNQMRDEMDKMFSRGWFESESEDDLSFKVGPYKITNQDGEYRFRAKLIGNMGDEGKEEKVEVQYEVMPTVVNFSRGLLASVAEAVGKITKLSTNIASAELFCLCGKGARYDRRVGNVHGWNTKGGYLMDGRKLVAMYFVNPKWREELGGHLQLEGVITPTGQVSIAPQNDRLVLFWADRTVWSMRPSRATTMSEHQFGFKMQMIAENVKDVDYDPNRFSRWFPELKGASMAWLPPAPEQKN